MIHMEQEYEGSYLYDEHVWVNHMKAVIYTTDTCAYCVMVKKFLTSKGVEYDEVNVDTYPERRQEAIDLSGAFTVPVTVLNNKIIVGWNAGKLVSAINN